MRVAGGFSSSTRASLSLKTLWNLPTPLYMAIPQVSEIYMRAHPEIPVLFTDCLSKPDRVIEKDGAKAVVVDGDPVPPLQIPAHFARNLAPQGAVRQEAPRPPPKRADEGNEGRPVPKRRQPDRFCGGGKPAALNQVVVCPHSETYCAHFCTLLTHICFIKFRSRLPIPGTSGPITSPLG